MKLAMMRLPRMASIFAAATTIESNSFLDAADGLFSRCCADYAEAAVNTQRFWGLIVENSVFRISVPASHIIDFISGYFRYRPLLRAARAVCSVAAFRAALHAAGAKLYGLMIFLLRTCDILAAVAGAETPTF